MPRPLRASLLLDKVPGGGATVACGNTAAGSTKEGGQVLPMPVDVRDDAGSAAKRCSGCPSSADACTGALSPCATGDAATGAAGTVAIRAAIAYEAI